MGRSKKDVIDTGKVKLINEYAYKKPGFGKTSLQVESIKKHDNSTVNYGYDALGNITSIVTDAGTYEYEYEYDYLNRLVKEYNPIDNRTMIILYKDNCNIQFKNYYQGIQSLNASGTPSESYEYVYDTSWKDPLVQVIKRVDGIITDIKNVLYNSNFMGNPSQIGDKKYTWEGRRLTHINSNIEYTYNENSIRISKKVDGQLTTYVLNGDSIIVETSDNKTVRYHYNERGLLVGFEFQNKQYFYIRDLLGIITGVVDENGQVVVEYKYDSWGKLINKAIYDTTIDEVNHFVYKGYYFDKETGLFMCGTRYYDPEVGRFISPDSIKYLDPSSINGLNLYSYCLNNPIMMVDPNGTSPQWWNPFSWNGQTWAAIGTIALDIGLIALTIATGGATAPLLVGALAGQILGGLTTGTWSGAFTGGILGLAVGGVVMMGPGAIMAGTWGVANKFISDVTALATYGKPFGTWDSYVTAFAFSGLMSGLGLPPIGSFAADVALRPAVDQLVGMGMYGKSWNQEKYQYDMIMRAGTYFLPGFAKPMARGFYSGQYNYEHSGKTWFTWKDILKNMAYA